MSRDTRLWKEGVESMSHGVPRGPGQRALQGLGGGGSQEGGALPPRPLVLSRPPTGARRGSCSKAPRTGGGRAAYTTVAHSPESGGRKSEKGGAGLAPPGQEGASGPGGPQPPGLLVPPAAPRPLPSSSRSVPHVCLCPGALFIRTRSFRTRAHPNDLTLTPSSARTPFPNTVLS